MQIDIYYRNIERSESLESFILEKINSALDEGMRVQEGTFLTVRVEKERERMDNRKPNFSCEILLKPANRRSVTKIRKVDEDFHKAVHHAALSLRGVKSRKRDMRKQIARRSAYQAKRDLPNLYEDWVA